VVIKFLGAAGTVTGSSYLLTSISGESLLIDCGLFQGISEIENHNYEALDIDPSNLLGVILTHAHLDHCGRLPLLIKGGFDKSIWMTGPTSEIAQISLFDTAKINNDKNRKHLYTEDDVDRTIALFKTVNYCSPFSLGPFDITLHDDGHIIGSASVEIINKENPTGMQKIVFSGDLGNSPAPLIRPTEMLSSADIVVIESTYGDRIHPNEPPENKVQEEINEIEKTGGTLLIPAFSIERSQELLHMISHLKMSGRIKNETEIIFDGPMGEKVTAVFEKYRGYYNQELTNDLKKSDPFHFPGLTTIFNYKDSQKEVKCGSPKVVIAGSGMMSGGRIMEYAQQFLPIDTTRLLFVGYQAAGTVGRQILTGAKSVRIDGVDVQINATVSETQAMSSHADQIGLLNWLKNIKGIKKVIITHGEDEARNIFAEKVKNDLGIKDIMIPNLNEEISV